MSSSGEGFKMMMQMFRADQRNTNAWNVWKTGKSDHPVKTHWCGDGGPQDDIILLLNEVLSDGSEE